MSWSVNAIGKASVVAERLAIQFNQVKCGEPEDTIKTMIAGAVAEALAAFPANYPVRVEASGSQSVLDFAKKPEEKTNQLSVKIEPIHGFLY